MNSRTMRAIVAITASALSVRAQSTGLVNGRVLAEGGVQALPAAITAVTSNGGLRLKTAHTEASGAFSLEVPAGVATLTARADGYASEQREVVVRPGRANPVLTFSLPRAGSVSGRVVDPTGSGVAGARVWLQYHGDSRAWRPAEETGGEPADATGSFTIPVVAQGRPFLLLAESDRWLLASSHTLTLRAAELRNVEIVLNRRGTSVTGRVLDSAGRPVADARVHLRVIAAASEFGPDQRNSLALSRVTNRESVCDADGRYSFDAIPSGRIVITAQRQQERAGVEVDVDSGSVASVDLQLR